MLITLGAVKGFTGLTNQEVKNPFTQYVFICRLLSRGRAKKKYDVEKEKSYENKMDVGMSYCSYNKQLLDSTFVISELNKVKVRVISPAEGRG